MPEEQRTAYILCEVDTKNYDEIANITGVPVGTVRSRIFRARQYLMENLKDRLWKIYQIMISVESLPLLMEN